MTYKENETGHPLFEPNNLLAIVYFFIYDNATQNGRPLPRRQP